MGGRRIFGLERYLTDGQRWSRLSRYRRYHVMALSDLGWIRTSRTKPGAGEITWPITLPVTWDSKDNRPNDSLSRVRRSRTPHLPLDVFPAGRVLSEIPRSAIRPRAVIPTNVNSTSDSTSMVRSYQRGNSEEPHWRTEISNLLGS